MSGKLPIDRVRARTIPARNYEDHKQTFSQDQVQRDSPPDAPIEPPAPVRGEPDEERAREEERGHA